MGGLKLFANESIGNLRDGGSYDASPLQVYSTYTAEEYDRKNEDVDPVAASAEYELERRE